VNVNRAANWLIRLATLLVPRWRRKSWREEWLAEIDYASAIPQRDGSIRPKRMLVGALADAATLRVLAIGDGLSPRTFRRAWQGVGRDIRLACRGLTTSPALTLAIVASLSAGLAASTAGFSVLQTLFFRPLPHVQQQEDLRSLCVVRRDSCIASFDDYARLRTHLDTAEAVAAHLPVTVAARIDGAPFTARAAVVSANYFNVLGVTPASGRFFSTTDEDAGMVQPVAVIGHGIWQREMAGRPDAVGRQMLVNGVAVRLVGVAPKGFVGVNPKTDGYSTGIWLPSSVAEIAVKDADGRPQTASMMAPSFRMSLVARLRRGASVDHLQAQASSIAASFLPAPPSAAGVAGAPESRALPRVAVHRVFLNDPASALPASLAFTGVPTIVLLIACVNAALLFVARASRRAGEWRVRLALGATRWRLVRQMLVEASALAAIGGGVGLFLTALLLRLQEQLLPLPVPLDLPVLLYTAGAVVCTALVFGIGPAWATATRTTVAPGSVGRYRPRTRTRSLLIGLQAALCVALLSTGTQFIRALQQHLDTVGVSNPDTLIVADLDLRPLGYSDAATETFYTAINARVSRLGGVLSGGLSGVDYWVSGQEGEWAQVLLPGEGDDVRRNSRTSSVDGALMQTLDLDLIRGRWLSEGDGASSTPPVVVNEAYESTLLEGSALGRTLRIRWTRSGEVDETLAVVVGVVAAPRGGGRLDNDTTPHLYDPGARSQVQARTLYVRATDVGQATAGIRALVASLDNRVPIDVMTLAEKLGASRLEPRWIAQSTTGLGLLGLLLTAGGLFGVVSYVVVLRTPEIGVRLALGASPRSVLALIVRQAMTPVTLGLVAGSGLAIGLGFVVESRLYGSEGIHPMALLAGAALLLSATGLASLIPARRASKIDPNVALRSPE
jgi:putative ABC transport system permease protein